MFIQTFCLFFVFCFFKFIYLFWGGEGQRERGRERILSRLCNVSMEPDTGLDITNWDHDLSRNQESDTSLTEPPSRPSFAYFLTGLFIFFFKNVYLFFEREREDVHVRVRWGGAEIGRQRIRSRPWLSVQSLTQDSNSWTMRPWPEPWPDLKSNA